MTRRHSSGVRSGVAAKQPTPALLNIPGGDVRALIDAAAVAQLSRGPLARLVLDVGDHHRRALVVKAPDRCETDARGAARDDHHLVGKPHPHVLPRAGSASPRSTFNPDFNYGSAPGASLLTPRRPSRIALATRR